MRADLQSAIDGVVQRTSVCHFCGVQKQHAYGGISFANLIGRDRNDPTSAAPPQYEEIDIGEPEPMRCLKTGLWLLDDQGNRCAVFLEPESEYRRNSDIGCHLATKNDEAGQILSQRFFRHLEDGVREARSYRGKILSLDREESYSGSKTGIKVHRLHRVEREQVILPRKTLDLLDRNVVEFVRHRPRLAEVGMATKKGLLFYGPPGTGKTHTLHYLAGALPGVTTLLISAEQVGILGEYMTLARLLQPSMVVIEDADLIGRERTNMKSACEEVLLNKLLNEMDGLRENSDVLFILTTNRPEALEAALAARPGRIDQAIEFPFPDDDGRAKLLRLYARGISVSEELTHATVRKTDRVSAAFIKELMRRATQFGLERTGEPAIAAADIDGALDELLFQGGALNRKLLGGQVDSGS
jgi:ATPase family associated with various cellular activities (AAA)